MLIRVLKVIILNGYFDDFKSFKSRALVMIYDYIRIHRLIFPRIRGTIFVFV